jgi:hypothetical protein
MSIRSESFNSKTIHVPQTTSSQGTTVSNQPDRSQWLTTIVQNNRRQLKSIDNSKCVYLTRINLHTIHGFPQLCLANQNDGNLYGLQHMCIPPESWEAQITPNLSNQSEIYLHPIRPISRIKVHISIFGHKSRFEENCLKHINNTFSLILVDLFPNPKLPVLLSTLKIPVPHCATK